MLSSSTCKQRFELVFIMRYTPLAIRTFTVQDTARVFPLLSTVVTVIMAVPALTAVCRGRRLSHGSPGRIWVAQHGRTVVAIAKGDGGMGRWFRPAHRAVPGVAMCYMLFRCVACAVRFYGSSTGLVTSSMGAANFLRLR